MTTQAVVYGKPDNQCIWCGRAKRILEGMGLSYAFKDVSANPDLLAELKELVPGVRSVPQIWIKDEYIGGHNDLVEWLKTSVAAIPQKAIEPEWNQDADFGQQY